MSNKPDDKPQSKPLNPNPAPPAPPDDSGDIGRGGQRGGIFSRLGEMLQTSRGTDRPQPLVSDIPEAPDASADELAMRRARGVVPKRMIVPEGVTIGGSITSNAETEISGRVEGDVTVDGRLYLGPSALISGKVRAVICKVEGLVEGTLECSQEIELGRTGRLNADVVAGKKITVAGQVFGNVSCGGMLCLVASGKVEGNIQARQLVVEEGATFNGASIMRTQAQRSGK